MSFSARVERLALTARYLGGRWVAFRIAYAARQRFGSLRRATPVRAWREVPPASLRRDVRFFFDAHVTQPFEAPLALADAIVAGRFPYFDGSMLDVGNPPDWHRNPRNGTRIPADRHWSEIHEFSGGDIKFVWEASRFLWAYPLVRAYRKTREEKYAETFWRLAEDWREKNPPNAGANWHCGQETSIRAFALCFALFGLTDAAATTDARKAMLAQLLFVSGERVAANIDYAVSQKNNHGISEAAGLFTCGIFFGQERWVDEGKRLLERQARELIYDDGAFSQHSMNYERVALHALLWAQRLADVNGVALDVRDRTVRAARFLFELQDESTGRLPHYGHNDGALILPLTNCEPRDYRPVIGAAIGQHVYQSGPWDEERFWLGLPVVSGSAARENLVADDGGYYTLRGDDGFAFVRAPKFRHRPSQADLLHTDIWWRGINVAMDGGTFSYNDPDPLTDKLAGTASHNTVMLDGRDQMKRASRFLWVPWPSAGVLRRTQTAIEVFHDGYAPARHRRTIERVAGGWRVTDHIDDAAPHACRLHWLLPDLPYELAGSTLRLITSAGDYFIAIDGGAVRVEPAEYAPAYSTRAPALSLIATSEARNASFTTHFSANKMRPS